MNDQEALEGLRSVAAAVKNPDWSVFGSLDISGPPYRLPPNEELAELLDPVVESLEAELELHVASSCHFLRFYHTKADCLIDSSQQFVGVSNECLSGGCGPGVTIVRV